MAFFLEASFLGILLFGRSLVPRWAHFFAALMVAAATLMSSFWILSAKRWMQTPVGYKIVDGRFVSTDWMAIIFNPSFPYRLVPTASPITSPPSISPPASSCSVSAPTCSAAASRLRRGG